MRPTQFRAVITAGLLAFLVGVGLGACGDGRSRCARVVCSGYRVCDEATGACVGGSTTDAGQDAGSDAGDDGGTDGGSDAGVDGGADAGLCTPACPVPTRCDPATHACVECLSDSDCHCPAPVCSAAQTCTAPSSDGGSGLPPPGETCATSPAVYACTGLISFTTNLAQAHDDHDSTCGSSGGGDVVYNLMLDATYDVRVTARPTAGSFAQPVVSVRRTCAFRDELGCSDGLTGTAQLQLKSLTAGSYFVFVDAYDTAVTGSVDVTVELLSATAPPNETCGTAATLTLDGGPTVVDLAPAIDDVTLSCNSHSDSPEAFFRLTLDGATDIVLRAVPLDSNVDPVLALRGSACPAGAPLNCTDTGGSGDSERLHLRGLDAGTYYVVVESYGRLHAGPVSVEATASPAPSNDTCARPRAIAFPPAGGQISFTVDTSLAFDDTAGSCNSHASSPEVVYRIDLGTDQTLTVSTGPLPTDGGVDAGAPLSDAVIYLRSTCSDSATELACDDQTPPTPDQFSQYLSAGTYYLFVEGYGEAGAGPTQVNVTLSP